MKNKLISFFAVIILVLPHVTYAQLQKPFGGKSILITPCTCDASFMVTILDAASMLAPTNYIYSPISTTLLGYMLVLVPNVYVLGNASPLPTQCMVTSPSGCTPVGVGFSMSLVGTSL
jgi:hypothetical protein